MQIQESGGSRKEMNFELNIVSFIDVMTVLITFLLMATVWAHMGVISTTQSVGDTNVSKGANPPSVWAEFKGGGSVLLTLKDAPRPVKPTLIPGRANKPDWDVVDYYVQSLSKHQPTMKTAIILPTRGTSYGDVVRMMDRMKKYSITEVGVSPFN